MIASTAVAGTLLALNLSMAEEKPWVTVDVSWVEGRSQLSVLVAYLRLRVWVPFWTVLIKAELTTREVILAD